MGDVPHAEDERRAAPARCQWDGGPGPDPDTRRAIEADFGHDAAMPRLDFRDHRADPSGWARLLGISREAVELYLSCDVIDLHVDSFIWTRLFGYDLTRRHGRGLFGGRFYSQVDLPRLREARVTGALWSVTTNPLQPRARRARVFRKNLDRLRGILASCPEDVAIVRTASEYAGAVAAGRHAAFFKIQGGNALDERPEDLDVIPDDLVVAVTVVHLSNSRLGATSSPLAALRGKEHGLTPRGRELVQRLNERRIFVDLAHVSRRGFFDAVEVHDRAQPLLVSHTGIAGAHSHWRNIDDAQIGAVADTGGTVGVMYQSSFLGEPFFSGRSEAILRHLEHLIGAGGEDVASLGSDWDGSIVTPRDMPTCLELPRLVQRMLDRRWSHERVRKVLGGNFLRALERLRPG
jgi:membrane dipeptidase